jgi:hypothetical protein
VPRPPGIFSFRLVWTRGLRQHLEEVPICEDKP